MIFKTKQKMKKTDTVSIKSKITIKQERGELKAMYRLAVLHKGDNI